MADNKDNQDGTYVWEYTVFYRRRFLGHFFEQGFPEEINAIRRRISSLMQTLHMPKSSVMHEILMAGLDTVERDVENGKKGKIPEYDDPNHARWAVAQEYKRLAEKRRRIAELEPIYADRGPAGFVEWCEKHNIDYKEFLDHFTWRSDIAPASDKDRNFLFEYLTKNGASSTEEVRRAAEQTGLVLCDTDWDRMRKTAERDGLHENDPRHGYWDIAKGQKD